MLINFASMNNTMRHLIQIKNLKIIFKEFKWLAKVHIGNIYATQYFLL